ncbi:hypothetical protein CBM2592_B100363 [Cupriavidus taiwanensis]|nr:hypothetical protein CBM2592_B100363 [Cupriavidus taiwanensis]SOY63077.1 hypothetical protein CBM2588_B130026 [Cupriavidus taiwanensis]SOY98150.1 hypothetical protein CBM2591_B80365 [Cupriavidus taiwanensis]SOZ85203.1 hypothetical protein CBM2618_B130041 [Cupriavidus taiwanensis]SOZ88662.1 hypothetical protein CBM2622_B140043 [Cupriavidus taiwanensis]
MALVLPVIGCEQRERAGDRDPGLARYT